MDVNNPESSLVLSGDKVTHHTVQDVDPRQYMSDLANAICDLIPANVGRIKKTPEMSVYGAGPSESNLPDYGVENIVSSFDIGIVKKREEKKGDGWIHYATVSRNDQFPNELTIYFVGDKITERQMSQLIQKAYD